MQTLTQQIEKLGGIGGYLDAQLNKSMLRFLTCGNVDDGKSTLIGRLLHDTRQIYEDQLANLHKDNQKFGTTGEALDLALLVDGLQAEREQGITIDIAYRYFSTEKRKFIIADSPGHEQYTRNMATAASCSECAIILIDARKGVSVQTRRHSYITNLMGIKHLIICINKMDAVDYKQSVFDEIIHQYSAVLSALPSPVTVEYIPVSALLGDNITQTSAHMRWYSGAPLLQILEDVEISPSKKADGTTESAHTNISLRFPVQYVNRPHQNFRGFAGTIEAGSMQAGQAVKIMPSGVRASINEIITFGNTLAAAHQGEAITVTFNEEVDVSRGDWIVDENDKSVPVKQVAANIVWMSAHSLKAGQKFYLKIAGKTVNATVTTIHHEMDINQLRSQESEFIELNGIALIEIVLDEKVMLDLYQNNHTTGGFILIDRISNLTVAAGMIQRLELESSLYGMYSKQELELNAYVCKYYPHWGAKNLSLTLSGGEIF